MCVLLFLLNSSVERYSAVCRRQGYNVMTFVTAVFWNGQTECTSDEGRWAQTCVVHNCQDILPGLFMLSFFFLLCVFSLHNINSDVYFSSSLLSQYTFFSKFKFFLYAFSPQFSVLLFQVFSLLLDIEFLHCC